MSKNASWATGSLKRPAQPARQAPAPPGRDKNAPGKRATGGEMPADALADRVQRFAADWAPTVARVLLGLVLAWFGYHELVAPQLWTGYVPVVSATSQFAIVLVLVHGWVLLMLAVAIIAGVALRLAAAIASLALLQIVITLTITGGLSDLTLRDVGVLGLAICLTGSTRQRAVMRG